MIISVTKIFEFCYGHRLPKHKGKCRNQHGHNAILEIEIGWDHASVSDVDNYSMVANPAFLENVYPGMVMDFSDLKDIVNEKIIDVLDHQYLNDVIPEVYFPPTAENMARWIWDQLIPAFGKYLRRIRIHETPDSYAEIRISDASYN